MILPFSSTEWVSQYVSHLSPTCSGTLPFGYLTYPFGGSSPLGTHADPVLPTVMTGYSPPPQIASCSEQPHGQRRRGHGDQGDADREPARAAVSLTSVHICLLRGGWRTSLPGERDIDHEYAYSLMSVQEPYASFAA